MISSFFFFMLSNKPISLYWIISSVTNDLFFIKEIGRISQKKISGRTGIGRLVRMEHASARETAETEIGSVFFALDSWAGLPC